MRHLPTILLPLSFPAGAIGYAVTVQVMTAILPGTSNDLIILLAALFVAGLVMLPFLIPFFDRKAKQDLAEYRRTQAAAGPPSGPPQPSGGASAADPASAERTGAEPPVAEASAAEPPNAGRG